MDSLSVKGSSAGNLLHLIGSLLIFVVILLIIWIVLRWMGSIQGKQMRGRNLSLVESIRVGNNKMISVVRAGEVYYLVAVGKDEIHLLGKLDDEQAKAFLDEEERRETQGRESFSQMLDKIKGKS